MTGREDQGGSGNDERRVIKHGGREKIWQREKPSFSMEGIVSAGRVKVENARSDDGGVGLVK